MKIIDLRHIEGANVYTHRPVILMRVDLGEFAEVSTGALPGFNESLLCRLPTLNDHFCSRGRPGGFVERLREGTYLGHVIEHVALELQHLAGMDAVYGKTLRAEKAGEYDVITECVSAEGGAKALYCAVECVRSLLENQRFDVKMALKEIRDAAARTALGPSTGAIAREAEKRGIPVLRLGEGSLLQLGYGKYQKRVEATITAATGCIAADIAGDKILVKELLTEIGIPVPRGGVARTEEEAVKIAKEIGLPVVVKPFNGNQGKGVAIRLGDEEDVRQAFRTAAALSLRVIVEKYITGRHYRLTVVGDQVVASAERIPAFVIGNGFSTIRQLVHLINLDPLRGESHEKPLTKIVIDAPVEKVLARTGLTPDSVPERDQLVYLRDNANLSTGGMAVDVTGQVHPGIIDLTLRAVRIVGLDVAGVDLVLRDLNQPLTQENGAIIEINAAPGIRMHHYPAAGQERNVARHIVEHLFPPGTPFRIPIVAVTGTNGKTTVTRLISHILQASGARVGTTTSDGIYLDGKMIRPGDNTGPKSARTILRDPAVEAAVLETARGGILRAGLGFDTCDVGIVTNISRDHLGLDGVFTLQDMAHVKAVVVEAVSPDGTAVLNADDKLVNALAERARSALIYFSLAADNLVVKRHLGAGGTAVFVKSGALVMAAGEKTQRILPVKQIPCTFGGQARHNIENCLAAAAGCLAMGTDLECIRQGLKSFYPDEIHNPGRLNVFAVGATRVVVDYGHNEAGYQQTLQTVRRMKAKRTIGVVGMPGDRSNEDIVKVGRIIARYCNLIIIKEDHDLRGRQPGEVAELMARTCLAEGVKAENIKICLPELEAVQMGLELAVGADTVVIFYEKFEPVLQEILASASRTSVMADKKSNQAMVN